VAALKTRNRAVIFRLTDEEYNHLKVACRLAGSRNLSDFTRNGVLATLTADAKADRLTAIEQRLESLQANLKALCDRLGQQELS
jgi:hypothetical protein